MSKTVDRFPSVVHTKSTSTFSFKIEYSSSNWSTTSFRSENKFKSTWFMNFQILAFVLVTIRMTSNYDRLSPSWNKSWYIIANNGFTKDSTIKDSSDGSVWRRPHFFKFKFFNTCFISCDCSTFNTNFVFKDSICRIKSNLIISLISIFHRKIIVMEIYI